MMLLPRAHAVEGTTSQGLRVLLVAAATALAAMAPASAGPQRGLIVAVPQTMHVRDLGSIDPSAPVHLGFVLANRHGDELERDVQLVSAKDSLLYHHYVSREAWNDYFAPSAQSVREVEGRLTRAGFGIERVAANRGVVDAVAPARAVERYFHTQFHAVAQPGRGIRFRNASPAVVPQELLASVAAVTGLDTIERYHLSSHPRLARRAPSALAPAAAVARIPGGPLTGPDTGYGPAPVAYGYRFPLVHGFDGNGTTVGITIPDSYLETDTRAFLRYFKVAQTGVVRRIPIDGGYTGAPQGEATLDTETISSLAPAAALDVYEFPDFSDRSITDTINEVVSDDAVGSVSNSWGGCESDDSPALLQALNLLFQQAALKGISFIFSSGDYGAYPCEDAPAVSSPASQPYVTALGGTHFNASASGFLTSQTATWEDGLALVGPIGSGGGVSAVWRLPAYQAKVRVSLAGRNVPDLSLPGDVEDAWYFEGVWSGPIGGTSWAAPAFNAMLAEVNEAIGAAHGKSGERSGFVNPSLYATYESARSKIVTDIVRGNNGADLGIGYDARPGYDLATGLGTPLGLGLAAYL